MNARCHADAEVLRAQRFGAGAVGKRLDTPSPAGLHPSICYLPSPSPILAVPGLPLGQMSKIRRSLRKRVTPLGKSVFLATHSSWGYYTFW